MPAEDYDARALALPIDDGSPDGRRSISPRWPRRSNSYARSPYRDPYSEGPPTLKTRVMRRAEKLQRHALRTYKKMTPIQRVAAVVVGLAAMVLGILFLVYNERIFAMLEPYAKKWRDIRFGWMILWALIFVVSFPPLIGYSSLLTIAGFVYGFPNGWFIAATATIIGSTCSFLVSRTILSSMVQRLVAQDSRFAALALTLKHDGLKLLVMIRLCPLPYSLSNGAIATFPTVHWAAFAAATTIASPKLLLHIFVGAKLGEIAEKGGTMDAKTKAISYLSALIGAVAGLVTGWIMYRKTKARAAELEVEERERARRQSREEIRDEYVDDPDALVAAETLREDDDDISLRDAYHDEDAAEYCAEFSEEEDPEDVFKAGDGDEEENIEGRR